jgi:hypothetical protein
MGAKTMFYISMYSGLRNPEMELSEELSKKISDLAVPLDKPFVGSHLHGLAGLASNHYMVHWEEGPVLMVMAQPCGYLRIYRSDDKSADVEDTVNLWAFLNAIGGYVLQKHHAEVLTAMNGAVREPEELIYNFPPLDIY